MIGIFRHTLFGLLIVVLTGACSTIDGTTVSGSSNAQWQLVYANDEEGNSLAGSKAKLIASIRAGSPVRIVTTGRRIDHATEAQFLSIFEGEVFAQIAAIESQRPDTNPAQILFRQPGQKWRSIVGTNGFVTALMDGGEPNVRKGPAKWFVQ